MIKFAAVMSFLLVEFNHPDRAALDGLAIQHCCQSIYLRSLKAPEMKQLLLHARSVHVGENEHFPDYGGAINLSIADA
ncbi:MAG TPA: hypothetical protein VGH38_18885 [Bryobacteraceae bacterium]